MSSYSQDQAKNCFGDKLKLLRREKRLPQKTLAKRIKKSRVMIANYESGRASPDAATATELAKALGENPIEFILLADLQKACQSQPKIDLDVLSAINSALASLTEETNTFHKSQPHLLKNYFCLADFPKAFEPLTVIVGDKREEIPQTAGDLFAFSGSAVDDRWLLSLGLSKDVEKISDKVLLTATGDQKNWLKERLGKGHILSIGSPASNLFTRIFNNCFLFRFAVGREAKASWEKALEEIMTLKTQSELFRLFEKEKDDLKHRMRLFKSPGFVNYMHDHLRVGMDLGSGKDFGVISIGRNPFADLGEPFYSILAAGVHHPGTAHAVKFLSEPMNFLDHPFGGVIEIDVPSKEVDPTNVHWHNRIEQSKAYWHSVGDSTLEYTPEELVVCLNWFQKNLSSIVTDIAIEEEELEEHLKLINRLRTDRKAPQ